jgi:CRP-like cAMP-binding protein
VAGASGPALIAEAALQGLAEHAQRRTFEAGDLLFSQGEPALRLYLLLEGRVMLESVHPHLLSPFEVGERAGGDVVGSEGIQDAAPRPWSARALVRTIALEITPSDIRQATP